MIAYCNLDLENIITAEEGQVWKLSGIQCATRFGDSPRRAHLRTLPPEVKNFEVWPPIATPEWDMYSLGCVLFDMLNGFYWDESEFVLDDGSASGKRVWDSQCRLWLMSLAAEIPADRMTLKKIKVCRAIHYLLYEFLLNI
jgi:serine/threonine protein kinase